MSEERVLGAYTLQSELGSGGMGTVYLAEAGEDALGVEAGKQVAVKIVHPQLVSTPGFFKRFMREAEVGKRINHENVVRTFDVDATEFEGRTVLFLVMEYVAGGTLRELQHELKIIPEALLREIALQVSAGLAAIHGESIIHRDLKPENVLITDDHQVQIMDLGVAKLQEASVAITKEGQFAGSFLYAAPEQFRSDAVGPKVDLYSLGVMLFELATGTNPFRGDDPASVIHAHLDKRPPRASELNPDTSEFTSEVMATLLAKKPEDRFDSAETLHCLLEEGEDSAWWHERVKQLKKRERVLPPIQLRRETELHGREKELAAMQAAWQRAKDGEGNTLLVEGEAGIGKTRLVDEFLRTLGDEDTHILYGAYPPSGGLGGLSDAILGKFGNTGLRDALAPYLTVTPSLIPSFAALIRHESPPTGSEPLGGDALHSVCCHLMQALAIEHPVIWVVDDLSFAPDESRALILAMARAVAGHRILLLLTARGGLPEEALAHLGRHDNFKRVGLQRLGAREVVELLADTFGSKALAEKLGGKIGYKSDGIPFFVLEMVRGLKEGCLLKKQADGTYAQTQAITDIEVPSAVRDLIEARLRGISQEERNLIDVAAVLGYEFDPDLVARVCEMRRVKVLQKLAALERSPGVVRAAGTAYRFDHNQVHELIYSALSAGLRQEYHALLAESMAEREGAKPDDADNCPGETAYFLALHGLKGSSPREGLPYLDRAMGYLQGSFRNASAARLADHALAASGLLEGADRVDMLLSKASCESASDGCGTILDALPIAEATGDLALLARCHSRLGSTYTILSQYDESRTHLDRAMEIARESGKPDLEPHLPLGSLSWYLGRYEEARGYFAAALAQAERSGTDVQRPTWGLGLVFWNLGRWAEARDQLQSLLSLSRTSINRENEYGALVNLGPLHAALGNVSLAAEVLEQSRTLARSQGNRYHEAVASNRLGNLAEQTGDAESARRLFVDAISLARTTEHPAGVVEYQIGLGRLEAEQGSGEAARQQLGEARDLASEIGAPGFVALASVHLACLGGSADAACKSLAEHDSRLDTRGRMEARFAMWKATDDAEHLVEAKRLLDYVRDHAPEECRETMIENVPLHRDIMAASEAQQA